MREVREVRVREARTLGRPVNADVTVPGSKSLANRALICAALAAGESVLTGCPDGDDTLRMIEAIQTLGCEVSRDLDKGECRVQGRSEGPVANADLFVGASGTCLRFLTALAAVGSGEVTIRGTERLHERPIGDLIDALRQLGASITCADGGYPPVTVHGHGLRGGHVEISGAVSSQFVSGLMLGARLTPIPRGQRFSSSREGKSKRSPNRSRACASFLGRQGPQQGNSLGAGLVSLDFCRVPACALFRGDH